MSRRDVLTDQYQDEYNEDESHVGDQDNEDLDEEDACDSNGYLKTAVGQGEDDYYDDDDGEG